MHAVSVLHLPPALLRSPVSRALMLPPPHPRSRLCRAGLPPRSVFGAAAHAGRILLFGGEVAPVSDGGHAKAGQFSSDCFSFDPVAKAWTKLEAEGEGPAPRGWMAACAVPEARDS